MFNVTNRNWEGEAPAELLGMRDSLRSRLAAFVLLWCVKVPVWAYIAIRLPTDPSANELSRWRAALLSRFDPDDFLEDRPLVIETDRRAGPMASDPTATWLSLNAVHSYYGRGYERGHFPWFVEVAELIESLIPDAQSWYGHEADLNYLRPFAAHDRAALLAEHQQVGHEPYDSLFRHIPKPFIPSNEHGLS